MSDTATDKEQKRESIGLKLAGISYIFADVMLIVTGVIRTGLHSLVGLAGGAALWLAGGLTSAFFGNPKVEDQVKIQAGELERHFKKQGIAIPENAREQSELLKKPGFFGGVKRFLYKYPSEVLNTFFGIGAGMMLGEGIVEIYRKKDPKTFFPKKMNLDAVKGMSTNFWMGTLVLAGAIIGLLFKEDPEARKKAKQENKGFLSRTAAFIKEKPLRVTGTFYGLNNVFLALSFVNDIRSRKNYVRMQPALFSGAALAAYVFANHEMRKSNRDQITDKGFSDQHIAKLEDAAARIIVAQSPDKQQELLKDASDFMSKQKGINRNASQIAQALADRITRLTGQRVQQAANDVSWAVREQARTPHASQQGI